MSSCCSYRAVVLNLGSRDPQGSLKGLPVFPRKIGNILLWLFFHWPDISPVRGWIRATILFTGFTFFAVNLPVCSINSYGIIKPYQMGITESTSYQIRICGLMCIKLGVLDTIDLRTTGSEVKFGKLWPADSCLWTRALFTSEGWRESSIRPQINCYPYWKQQAQTNNNSKNCVTAPPPTVPFVLCGHVLLCPLLMWPRSYLLMPFIGKIKKFHNEKR